MLITRVGKMVVSETRVDKLQTKSLLIRILGHWEIYLMFLPAFVYFVIFRYWPMVLGIITSFKNLKIGLGIFNSQWVGLENYRAVFSDPAIVKVISNTVEISLLRIIFGFLPPIILAIVFYDLFTRKFKNICQTLVYIPYFFSWVIVYAIVLATFSTGSGFVNNIIALLGLKRIDFLLSEFWFRPILIFTDIWKNAGWSSILYTAALSGIDHQIYESAMIDGAGPIKRIIHITIPGIAPVITFSLCLTFGNILRAGGEQVLLFYNPAVYNVGDIIDTWVYRVGLGQMQYSVGTAVGLFQSIVGMIMILFTNYLSKRYSNRSIW